MKTLFLIFMLLVLSFVSFSQSEWQIVSPPVSENFMSVSFTDHYHGTIVSKEGSIISTSDAGNTWQVNPIANTHFESVHFVDESFGCITGWYDNPLDSSRILITTDGGNTWSFKQHPNALKLYDIFFINDQIGWSVGYNEPSGWIIYTDDGGDNWTRQMEVLGVSGELYGVHFRDESIGNICGVNAMFLHTNNGGTIGNGWALNISIPTLGKDLYSIYNFSGLQGCAVGADGSIIYTVDNWANWIQMISNITDTLWSVINVEGTQHLWAVGNNGTIVHNQMYILPWEIQQSNVTEKLNDVSRINETEGWAVGENGTILHFAPVIGIGNKTYHKVKIFPNPVNNMLIVYVNNKYSYRYLQIIDRTGRLIEKQNISNQTEIMLDVSDCKPGLYFLEIYSESDTIIKKLIIQ